MEVCTASFFHAKGTIYEILNITRENLRKIEKSLRRLLSTEFEHAFEAYGGPYEFPVIKSPCLSDIDDVSLATEPPSTAAGYQAAKKADAFTLRSAYGSILMNLSHAIKDQATLAQRLGSQASLPVMLNVVRDSQAALLRAVQECFDFVYSPDAASSDPLEQPADEEILTWMNAAGEVERRTRGLLSWAQLKNIGQDAMQSKMPPQSQQQQPSLLPKLSPAQPTQPEPPQQSASLSSKVEAPAKRQAFSAASSSMLTTEPIGLFSRSGDNMSEDDDSDSHSHGGQVGHLMDATGLLKDFAAALSGGSAEDEINFELPQRLRTPSPSPEAKYDKMLFDEATKNGRRNMRARELLSGTLVPTNEEMTVERQTLVAQCSTLREMLSIFGKLDYNAITYQVRTSSQQIGESGPLLWTAALDMCISTNYADEMDTRKKWMEERMAAEPQEPNEVEQYKWIELLQSEPCSRGSSAKLRIVSMGAILLFPREYEFYSTLKRDDVLASDNSVVWKEVQDRAKRNKPEPFGRMANFVLNRTSFIAQAFQQIQNQRPDVGDMAIDIATGYSEEYQYKGKGRPESYTVSIIHSNGTVLVTQSSRAYQVLYQDELLENASLQQQQGANVPTMVAALVPTLFDALYNLAEKLGLLSNYLLLKRSFDRLQIPMANEPREYVLSYLTLVFGMCRGPNGALKDAVIVKEQAVPGGWCATVCVSIPRRPMDNASDFNFINVEERMGNTKKLARNEALLYLGKTNFTAEMLHMLDYGPVAQKAHAEVVLLVDTAGVIPVSHPLRKKMAELTWAGATSAEDMSKAPGEAVVSASCTLCKNLTVCDQIISHAIKCWIPQSTEETKAWAAQNYSAYVFDVKWDAKVMDTFFATLPRVDTIFGLFSYTSASAAPWSHAPSCAESEGEQVGHVEIAGKSPISALQALTRLLRERLDNPAAKVKELKQNAGASPQGKPDGLPSADVSACQPLTTATLRDATVDGSSVTQPPCT